MERILLLLKDNNQSALNATEISDALGLHVQTVRGHMNRLVEIQCVKEIRGRTRSISYKYLGSMSKEDLNKTKPRRDVVKSERAVLSMEISPAQLFGLINKWSQEAWNPKAFSSARNLPLGLARLAELAFEAAHSSPINQTEVDIVRTNLDTFRMETEQLLRVVNGVLSIEALWDAKTFAAFMLEGAPADTLKDKAFEVKKRN
jgi:hypothetical protein